MGEFTKLDEVLGQDTEELTAKKKGVFTTDKLGKIPYTAVDAKEYRQAKKDCTTMKTNPKTRQTEPDFDDDRLMVKVIIAAVDKDERTDFTFANKQLINKLNEKKDLTVVTAEDAVDALLAPGEIYNFAIEIQDLSGFGPNAKEEMKEDIKN